MLGNARRTLALVLLLITSANALLASVRGCRVGCISLCDATRDAAPLGHLAASAEQLKTLRKRDMSSSADVVSDRSSSDNSKYSTYNDISTMLAASRKRSYEQGRQGCCGKNDNTRSSPPPDSPWCHDA